MERLDKNKDNKDDITFSIEGVAILLEVSPHTVKDWVDTRKLHSLHTGSDGEQRFRINEVVELMLKLKKRELGME